MDDQLLVRLYNVGLGDCIYLRVPDQHNDVHILIDCGNKFGDLKLLGECIADLKKDLPDAGAGKKRLDLLVVTHPHEDHHKGFEEEFFKDLKIERIWLSPAFNRLDPKAQGFHALQAAAMRALNDLSQALSSHPETALSELKAEVDDLLSLTKEEAIQMLCHDLPQDNGIQPLYVTADAPKENLKIFEDPAIQLKVLGPMSDIDNYYLGGDGLAITPSNMSQQGMADGYQALFAQSSSVELTLPRNVSSQDFKQLRSRMRVNALAAAEVAGHAVNNLSVVLLLEWHGRRLLFPGDAEWNGADGGEVKAGRSNGSWNVMWKERKTELSKPLDFLKIGHHGSENATPWTGKKIKDKEHPINQILDALLPTPAGNQAPKARAVASTRRTKKWPSIPDGALMAEIGKRVANARMVYHEPKSARSVPDNTAQPQRTDLENQATGKVVDFIEISFKPDRNV